MHAQIICLEGLRQTWTNFKWVSNKEFTNRLSDDVSDGFILTTRLVEVQWHQVLQVVLQALWFIDDDFLYSIEVHVLLLLLRLVNQPEYFRNEEISVADGDTSERDGRCLAYLIVLMLKQV